MTGRLNETQSGQDELPPLQQPNAFHLVSLGNRSRNLRIERPTSSATPELQKRKTPAPERRESFCFPNFA
jgi:hypothetical protein